MKIWLLTLPEKFQEWYDYHDPEKDNSGQYLRSTHMDLFIGPTFPVFNPDVDSTTLHPNPKTHNYMFLPARWNLLVCFEYFKKQEGDLWTTNSIEENLDDIISQDTATVEDEEENSCEDDDESQQGPAANDQNQDSDEEQEEDDGHPDDIHAKKSSEEEIAGSSKSKSRQKRKSSSRRHSGRHSSGSRKRARNSSEDEKIVTAPVASKLIFEMGSPLHNCDVLVDRLLKGIRNPQAKGYLVQVKGYMEEIMSFQNQLLSFAEANKNNIAKV